MEPPPEPPVRPLREPAAQDANEQHDSKDREQVKGGRPADGPQKPREPGKLPLPE